MTSLPTPDLPAVVRPLTGADVSPAAAVVRAALDDLATGLQRPLVPWSPEVTAAFERRIAFASRTDPDGSFVAEHDGGLVGFAQAFRRDELWMLSYLFVDPAAQRRHVGRALLEAACAYARPGDRGNIVSSPDPKAMHRYLHAGFDLHPSFTAAGTVRVEALPPTPRVRAGDATDLPLVDAIDRVVRGATRGPDIADLLAIGAHLFVAGDDGYVLLRHNRVTTLAATDEGVAGELLVAGLRALAGKHECVEVTRMVASQQWAMHASTAAGLELSPSGPWCLRGWAPPDLPYLPDPALG